MNFHARVGPSVPHNLSPPPARPPGMAAVIELEDPEWLLILTDTRPGLPFGNSGDAGGATASGIGR